MARRYAAEHGTLAAPKDAVVEGYPVGRWLQKRRAQGKAGTLAAERDVALDALVEGEEWNPATGRRIGKVTSPARGSCSPHTPRPVAGSGSTTSGPRPFTAASRSGATA